MRINIIGYSSKGMKDDGNQHVTLDDLDSQYSVDTTQKRYRIEFYQENRFCGMVLAHFK